MLSAQTLNEQEGGLSWACAMEQQTAGTGQYLKGTCVTHIPETPAFPFHKGGRRTGSAAYYPYHVVIR